MWRNSFKQILRLTLRMYLLTDQDCSKECFIGDSSIRQWKSGKALPSEETFQRLCDLIKQRVVKLNDFSIDYEHRAQVKGVLTKNNCISSFDDIFETKNSDFADAVLRRCFYNSRQEKKYNRNPEEKVVEPKANSKTKVIVFDFDGTLTIGKTIKTTWESLWTMLGYDVQDCQRLHIEFDEGRISHSTWCKLTEEKFKAKGLTKDHLKKVAKHIKLMPDIEFVFKFCRENNIKIYIVSGSIKDIIQEVLSRMCWYINGIKANDFTFAKNNFLDKIIGTEYDFEGKATFISKIVQKQNISPENVLFIGNSINDHFAYKSGARTLCINPSKTNPSDKQIWHDRIDTCNSLKEIIPYIIIE